MQNLESGPDRKEVLIAIRHVVYWAEMAQCIMQAFAAAVRFVHGVGEADSSQWKASMATVHWYISQVEGFVYVADGLREWLKTFIVDFIVMGRPFDGQQRGMFVQHARDVAPVLLEI